MNMFHGEKNSIVYVTLQSGAQYRGKVIWEDAEIDLAIIKINAKDLSVAQIGYEEETSVGEVVYAIGNPVGFEFERTVTSGIISGKKRTVKIKKDDGTYGYMEGLIQTDAAINEGNSGGALINGRGKIIGITSAKIAEAQNIGFAIPIEIIEPILNSLIEKGEFEEAYLGIYGYDKEVIPYLNDTVLFENGIYVAEISEKSNLKNSSLRRGDIIVRIDDKNIEYMTDLRKYIYSKKPGDYVTITILRNNKEHKIKVKLRAKL